MRRCCSMPARSTATRTARRRHLMALALSVTATIRSSARRAQASPERRHCNNDQKWRGASIWPAPHCHDGRLPALNYIVGMCGRATYKLTWEEIVALYRLTLDQPALNTRARYNVCPTTTVDVILNQDG